MNRRVVFVTLALVAVVDAHGTDYCFGAVGQQCGGISISGVNFAACAPFVYNPSLKICAVSAGSMTHDPCCADLPYGKMCGHTPENQNQCASQWNRAVHRFVWGYQWTRLVDPTVPNTSGDVVRADYCAQRGDGLHKNDVEFCCSRDAQWATWWERIPRPSLKICR